MKLQILLAEDSPDNLAYFKKMIDAHPEIQVRAAFKSALKAVDYFVANHQHIDALFLDIRLSEGTAFDILRKLVILKITIPPVVIITAERDQGYVLQMKNTYNEEIVYYFQKPFDDMWREEKHLCVQKVKARLYLINGKKTPETSSSSTTTSAPPPQKKKRRKRLDLAISGGRSKAVRVEDISYIFIHDKITRIFVDGFEKPFTDPLSGHGLNYYKDLIDRPETFIRASRQLLINSEYVEDIADDYRSATLS
jgi:DNA-binding LytR/AlgR family response regulator